VKDNRECAQARQSSHRCFRLEQSERAEQKLIGDEGFDRSIDIAKHEKRDEKAGERKAVAAEPVEIAMRLRFVHEQHDAGAAVEWGNRKKIEDAKEQIEGKENVEHVAEKAEMPRGGIEESSVGMSDADANGCEEHQCEVGGGTGHGHPGGTARMAALPVGIIGSAGPADHGAPHEERNEGDDNHAPRRAANVRDGVERNLPAQGSGLVATDLCGEGMRGFVAGSREEKGHVPHEAHDEKIGSDVRHEFFFARRGLPAR